MEGSDCKEFYFREAISLLLATGWYTMISADRSFDLQKMPISSRDNRLLGVQERCLCKLKRWISALCKHFLALSPFSFGRVRTTSPAGRGHRMGSQSGAGYECFLSNKDAHCLWLVCLARLIAISLCPVKDICTYDVAWRYQANGEPAPDISSRRSAFWLPPLSPVRKLSLRVALRQTHKSRWAEDKKAAT